MSLHDASDTDAMADKWDEGSEDLPLVGKGIRSDYN